MTWTIIIGGVCAAWLVYEYRTAPIIESLDGMTGNECQCHGLQGSNSTTKGSLRRAKEGNDGMSCVSDSSRDGGFRACRINGVDCVASHRRGVWEVGVAKNGGQWMWRAVRQFDIRRHIAKLATAGSLTWEEAAKVNAFLMCEELKTCKTN